MIITFVKVNSNNNFHNVGIGIVENLVDAKRVLRLCNQIHEGEKGYYEAYVDDNNGKRHYLLYDGKKYCERLFDTFCKKYKMGKYNV